MVRIFIADDRELVRSTLGQALRQADASWEICGEAANGREAIEKAIQLAPDLIILDIAMPVLDGIGAAKEIHAQLPDVPIVMYTFLVFEHLELVVKEAGAQALVQKGDLRALFREIRRVLAETPQVTAVTASDNDVTLSRAQSTIGATEVVAAPGVDAAGLELADGPDGDAPSMGETESSR